MLIMARLNVTMLGVVRPHVMVPPRWKLRTNIFQLFVNIIQLFFHVTDAPYQFALSKPFHPSHHILEGKVNDARYK